MPSELRPVRIGVAFHSPFYAPLFIAHRLGLFREEGLEPSVVIPPPAGTADLLQAGKADVILSGVMRSLVLADRGGPRLVAIAEVNSRDGFVLLAPTPSQGFSWRELKGQRLALFGLAPTPWMCLQSVLRQHGIDPARVQVLRNLDVAQGIAALQRSEADYLQIGQPAAQALMDEKLAHLAAPQAPAVGHVPYSSLLVTDETRRTRPELCLAVVRGVTRALRWIAAHEATEVADAIAPEFPDTRPTTLRRAVTRLKGADTWREGPRQDAVAFQRFAEMLVEGGLIRAAAPYEALVDDRFADEAVRALGGH